MGAEPVPAEHQIRGLGPITHQRAGPAATDPRPHAVMDMRQVASTQRLYRRRGAPSCVRDGRGRPGRRAACRRRAGPAAVAQPGAGGVHHVAFRVPDDDTYQAWTERLRDLRVPSSGPVDRFYFRSLYFREPNGILFEIATDGPGFAADEPLETLGEKLSLPPFLEAPRRRSRRA